MERINTSIKGLYRDILQGPDKEMIYDSGWVCNTIVDRCRILLAGFMSNGPSDGIQYLAVGRGEEEWDTDEAPVLDPATTFDLVNRFPDTIPVADLELAYLDESDEVTSGPTNRLQITATLEPGYPTPIASLTTYPLREFGLFGRFNGTDYMINSIRHPLRAASFSNSGFSAMFREACANQSFLNPLRIIPSKSFPACSSAVLLYPMMLSSTK